MHEVGLVAASLEQAERVARGAGAARIARVTLAITAGGHLTREAVETVFGALSQGTLAEGATLVVEELDARWGCLGCGASFLVVRGGDEGAPVACPACGAPALPNPDGAELALTSIDVEE